jgi:hypothetical protein
MGQSRRILFDPSRRRRYLAPPALGLMLAAGLASPAAQDKNPYPIFTPENLESTMKTVGLNFGGASQALAKGDYETAKPQFVRLREQLATTITFWRDRKRDDAIKMVRNAVTKLDDLDTALSAETVDPAAVSAIAKEVGAACEACHSVYREQDPVTKAYRVKASALH